MSNELDKAAAFVSRLLCNPAMNDYTSLQKEEQVLQFLSVNSGQLLPTLSSPAFFAGESWNQILVHLVQALKDIVGRELEADLDRIVAEDISLSFLPFLGRQVAPETAVKAEVLSFLLALLRQSETRRSFTGPYTALRYRAVDKYIDKIFERKAYIHFELSKVQRLRMSKDEIKDLLSMTLLLRAAVYVAGADAVSNSSDRLSGVIQGAFADRAERILKAKLSNLPEQVLESAVHANMSFSENRYIEATSRMAAIFSARYRNYKANVKVDRGADPPDKSWFSVARKNARFFGFDEKMLEELYKIAAENGW